MNRHLHVHRRSSQKEKLWLNMQYHPNGFIKRPGELEDELSDPPVSVDENILDRVQGSMTGIALGDALGAHVEFKPHSFLAAHPVKDLVGGGTWGLNKGEFTDDTSMTLCLGNSLVAHQGFFPYDQLVRYKWWFRNGYMSAIGSCFDIGASTQQSLMEFERRQIEFSRKYNISYERMDYLTPSEVSNKFNVICGGKNVAGNGSLMRLAPVPLFFYRHPKKAVEYCGLSAIITHDDQRAYDACRYYGALIVAALQGVDKNELLDKNFYFKHKDWFNNKPLHSDIMNIAQGSYQKEGGYSDGIRGTGYVVNALEAALWAFFYDRNSFEYGALAAVNLGDDTDTTAAIYGQLAGAYYGYDKLPKKWLDFLYGKTFIQCLSKWIVYEGERWQPNRLPDLVSTISVRQQRFNSATNLFNNQNTNSNMYTTASQFNSHRIPEKFPETSQESVLQLGHQVMVETEPNKYRKPSLKPMASSNFTAALTPQYVSNSNNYSHLQSTSNNPMYSMHPKPLQPMASMPMFKTTHFYNNVETCEDVCFWIASLGEEYVRYAPNFKKNNVDGFQLLHVVDQNKLIQYGVQNTMHQRRILDVSKYIRCENLATDKDPSYLPIDDQILICQSQSISSYEADQFKITLINAILFINYLIPNPTIICLLNDGASSNINIHSINNNIFLFIHENILQPSNIYLYLSSISIQSITNHNKNLLSKTRMSSSFEKFLFIDADNEIVREWHIPSTNGTNKKVPFAFSLFTHNSPQNNWYDS
ncbi:unnamed protein product [Rotaria sordida]|uniref:ADP-ribosylhydrolase ARH3 n=1 Tax=Rotaria sordida TaxID=392033 RepID=A0A814A1C7_9BILA|nr:unnamed protein product [Rotaria sordida]